MERLKHLVGYMHKQPNCAIRFRTGVPDFEGIFGEATWYDWMETVCGCPKEEIDPHASMPLGKPVRTWSHVDANLMYDVVTGRSVSSILEYLNQTLLIGWPSISLRLRRRHTVQSMWLLAKVWRD